MALLFLLFMSMILMGIGYASIQSVTGEITGKASSKMQDGVFITNVEYVSDVDANKDSSNIEPVFWNNDEKYGETFKYKY